jgi:glycosyltransferase involved in cell wall biosynthesis
MRITVVIGAFLPMPPAPTGAIEKVWHRLSEAFAARGHEVVVVAPAADGERGEETIHGVRRVRLPRWNRTGSTKLDLVKDFFYSTGARRVLPPADVTVTNCFWLPAILRVLPRAEIGALDVHVQRFPKGQMGLYRNAERISTVSVAIASAIREQTPALADRIAIVGNPVDVAVFTPEGPCDRVPGERRVVFTGRVHPEKGLDLLVRAFAQLAAKDASLRLAMHGPIAVDRGGGGPGYVEKLRSLAGGAPIEFPGNIADVATLARTLRSCDVYCYPSIAYFGEASPVAPLEAMASGAVPVVSDLPQFSGYVRDEETGLVFAREAPDAVDRLARQLARVLYDEPLRTRLRESGVARAQEFSVDRIAELHLEAYARLVETRRTRGRTPSA